MPWAKLAYNSTVHRALSEGTKGLTPAEVHLGRRMNLMIEKALESQKACKEAKSASAYVRNLAKHVEAMKAWIKQSREKYNARMKTDANKKAKKMMQHAAGDLVSLMEERHQGTEKKIKLPYEGPFKILEATGDNEYTIQRVVEGVRVKTRVHADRLIKYHDIMELDKRKVAVEPVEDDDKEIHEVEVTVDHDGSLQEGPRRYKVRWAGWGEEHDSWLYEKNLVHCAELVQEYELAQVGVATVMCIEEISGQEGLLVAQVEATAVPLSRKEQHEKEGSAVTVSLDLNGSDTPEELLNMICRKAGINRNDIVLTWPSPLCGTFSRANWSNTSRGNHHRKKEEGLPPVEGEKGDN